MRLFPTDIFQHIISFLQLHGPKVVLIEAPVELIQQHDDYAAVRADVLAVSGEAPSNLFQSKESFRAYFKQLGKTPDLSVYHLIRDASEANQRPRYHIGFCKQVNGKLSYHTVPLGEKSPLLRFITQYAHFDTEYENRDVLKPGAHWNRELVKYVEEDIQKAGGLTFDWIGTRERIYALCDHPNFTPEKAEAFKERIRPVILQQVFHNLTYCDLYFNQ